MVGMDPASPAWVIVTLLAVGVGQLQVESIGTPLPRWWRGGPKCTSRSNLSFAAQGPGFDGALAFDFDGAARFERIAALEVLNHTARDLNGIR